ncbi:MFS transporter [Hamadaea sp. NPDC051192]|uniref:MFS transporter n=1 Tax=Hamadaea sp. NPDC051192 TaxID=3154940 RepID=UPI00342DE3BA
MTSATKGSFDRRLLAPMMLGAILNPINSSILAVSLVPIGIAFGAPPAQTAWLVGSLYLATAIGQPVVGRLIDLYGPRRLFLTATVLVGVAGVIGFLAPNLGTLILARVLLGFGTCAGYPAAMYLIGSEARRTGMRSPAGVLTALAVATQTITVIGPALGGLLISVGGWRATLAINVPLAIAGLALGARYLPRTAKSEGRVRDLVDLPGIALFAPTLVALLVFLLAPRSDRWYLPVLAAVLGGLFVRRELHAANPFVDVRVLAGNRPLIFTYLRAVLAATVSYGFLYGVTQWLQDGRGLSAAAAGLVQLPVFGTGLIVSSLTGRNPQIRGKLIVASASQLVAATLLLVLTPATPVVALLGVMVVFGIPQGLNSLALQNSVYYQADPARMGSSAGLLRTAMYLGAMLASAATGAFFPTRADTPGLRELGWFLVAIAAAYLVVTLVDRSLTAIGRAPDDQDQVVREMATTDSRGG